LKFAVTKFGTKACARELAFGFGCVILYPEVQNGGRANKLAAGTSALKSI